MKRFRKTPTKKNKEITFFKRKLFHNVLALLKIIETINIVELKKKTTIKFLITFFK